MEEKLIALLCFFHISYFGFVMKQNTMIKISKTRKQGGWDLRGWRNESLNHLRDLKSAALI